MANIVITDKDKELLRVILRDFKARTQGNDGHLTLSNNSYIRIQEWERLMEILKISEVSEHSTFRITGIDRAGNRFTINTDELKSITMTHIHMGTIWEIKQDGTKRVMKKIKKP